MASRMRPLAISRMTRMEVPPAGVEPATYGLGNRPHDSATVMAIRGSDKRRNSVARKVATDTPENGCERLISAAETDPELARVVTAWPKLSAVVKRMILAALDADQGHGE